MKLYIKRINASKIKDETVYYESSKTGVEVVYKDGWYRLRKDGKYSDFKTSDLTNAKFIADREYIIKSFRWLNDSIKDEANLPTTIQALVNDEEAAIKAYEVAIKNLEGKIDETQMQVLINIMKDERRHVENLYAILNNQVTEKNLKDSVTSDLFKAIDKLYGKYGDLDVLTDTELDKAIKELAATLPNVKYDDFKDVVENFIGERRLRERMKRSGLTYFKR